MKKVKSGGGWPAVFYTLRKAREAGGLWKLWKAMRSRNACKTCALGMGGQRGGMVNERGQFPEVCKKSMQAMVADMQGAIKAEFWQRYSPDHLKSLSPRELESCGRLVQPVLHTAASGRYTPISWDQAFDRISAKLAATPADETFWYFSGRSSNEAGLPAATLRSVVRHEQREQLQLLLPPGKWRGSDERHWQWYGHHCARRPRQVRSGVRHWRQPRVKPSATDANADGSTSPRRQGDCRQSDSRDRHGELQCAKRRA